MSYDTWATLRFIKDKTYTPNHRECFDAGAAEKEAELRAEIDKLKAQQAAVLEDFLHYKRRFKRETLIMKNGNK